MAPTTPEPPSPEPAPSDGPTPEPPSSDAQGVVGAVRKDKLRAALFDEPIPERWLGRYRVIGALGRGGMSTVLEAVDDVLERRVALKLLHRDVSPRDQGRLLREARALAKLSHPNVVQVHEVGEEPRPFIAMELVRGRTLAQWQRDDAPSWRACVRAYLQAGRGLAAAHAQALVHRDFKPSNCMIDDEGRVRVMDFGLARVGAARRHDPLESDATGSFAPGEDDASMTGTGEVLGTLAYMPLEQLRGEEVDARSDQFSFCVALHEALYGRRPFEGRTLEALEQAMAEERVVPPSRDAQARSRAGVRASSLLGARRPPPALRRVLLRGLRADPEARWPSMPALLVALEALVRPRWRGRLAVATVVLGASLAGLSAWRELSLREACTGVEAQLAGVWDDDRREALREALLAAPQPFARAAWEDVGPRLDAYATAWLDASRDVCEEARIRQEQPESVVARRTACLHGRKVALREAVDVLEGAQPATVERAVGLVSELPSVERCRDVEALLAELPPPEDPQVGERVQALRDDLSAARTLRIAGRYADSLAAVERVAEAAGGVAYPPLHAEVEQHRGWALKDLGRDEEAAAAFEAAYAGAVAEGHDAVAADAAGMLTFLLGARQTKRELGIQWSVVARAHAQRPAVDPGVRTRALANLATVYVQVGELEQAKAVYEETLRLQEAAFGPDDLRLAFTLNGLAVTLLNLNQVSESIALHERALELRRRALGPYHPYVAMSLNNIGVGRFRQARLDEAERYLREALEIKEAILGPDHPELASSLSNLASLASLRRDDDGALALHRRAIAIVERSDGTDSAKLAPLLFNVGALERQQGRLDDADATYRRVLAILDRTDAPDHVDKLRTLHGLGRVAIERGDLAAAAEHAARMQVALDRPDHPLRLDAMQLRVRLGLARGDAASVVALAEQAYEERAKTSSPALPLAETRLLLSRALGEADPRARDRARELAERSRDELAHETDAEALAVRAEIDAWLAELKRRDPPR